MTARLQAVILLVCALALAACGETEREGSGGEAASTPTPTAAAEEVGCRKVKAPEPKGEGKEKKPTLELEAGKTYVATVKTSCGEFEITLDPKQAPRTGGSFVTLAKKGFYDGTTFHRISPGFVIQGGDPVGNGTGGPGYSIVETPPEDLAYTRGVVAMAKTGTEPAGTSGSQFFVVTAEDAQLPPQYALLGRITGGEDVVDRIATVPTNPGSEEPADPVVIEKVTIAES